MNNQSHLRIAIVGSVLARFDAIANDIVRTAGYLREVPGWEVAIFAAHNEFSDVNVHIVPRVSDLLRSPAYLDADVIIYHFGIYYPLFNAIIVGNGHAKQAVVFYNITPVEYVGVGSRRTIEKSFSQLENIRNADEIWPVSKENYLMLLDNGFEANKLVIQPLAVERPPLLPVLKSKAGPVNILFVGRIVWAKGIHELLKAIGNLVQAQITNIRLKIVGDLAAADPAYRAQLLELVTSLKLEQHVEFLGAVSEDTKDSLYVQSHILAAPSYHEGFCVPVIEGLRAGLIPVVYSAYNLKYIADGLCLSCSPADIDGLTSALEHAIKGILLLRESPSNGQIRLDRGEMDAEELQGSINTHLSQFTKKTVAQRLQTLVNNLHRNQTELTTAATEE